FHPSHDAVSLSCPNLTQGGLGLLHAGNRIEAVGGDAVDAFAEHHGIATLGVVAALIDALEPAREVEWTPGDALADTLGDERLHAGFRIVLGTGHPDPGTVLDAALGGIGRIDLDEHVLLQFGEPLVGARLLAAAFIFDQTA